ncbi:hypothetical protein QUF54_01940 [Candidatus Marithioploca araucensis]|uniref:Uncharacterized protein n=1 Tax=Candidatus Marithioploca araucensis TaxID=70273 RepID=A0ABT7VR10_9GAMM|nr:hypothetical protein [Candidatus Marithioploca araucensis]
MYAKRLILETDELGNIKELPKLPANKQFETLFLVLENVSKHVKRTPHPDIISKVKIMGEIFDSIPVQKPSFLKKLDSRFEFFFSKKLKPRILNTRKIMIQYIKKY